MPNGDGTGPLGNGCRGGQKRGQQNGNGKGMGMGKGRGLGLCRNQKNRSNVDESANQSIQKDKI